MDQDIPGIGNRAMEGCARNCTCASLGFSRNTNREASFFRIRFYSNDLLIKEHFFSGFVKRNKGVLNETFLSHACTKKILSNDEPCHALIPSVNHLSKQHTRLKLIIYILFLRTKRVSEYAV